MTIVEISKKLDELHSWKNLLAEAEEVVKNLESDLKSEMVARGVHELEVDSRIVRFTPVSSNRFDSTTFKKDHMDLYKQYTKVSTSMRFKVSE